MVVASPVARSAYSELFENNPSSGLELLVFIDDPSVNSARVAGGVAPAPLHSNCPDPQSAVAHDVGSDLVKSQPDYYPILRPDPPMELCYWNERVGVVGWEVGGGGGGFGSNDGGVAVVGSGGVVLGSAVDPPMSLTLRIAPKKRANNNRKTTRNDEISPFNLEKAGIYLNKPLEEVMVAGSRATDEYLSFHNVDPTKVVRGRYLDCMRFLNTPEYVFLDCYIKGYTVRVQFWQELVHLLCKGGYYKHQKFNDVGWLSDDQINCWMELIIRARPPGARYRVAKTRMASSHLGTQKFILETDEHLIGMLDGSSRPYPSCDDVDIVNSLPNDARYPSLNAHLSKWTSLLNVMLQRAGHFERTKWLPYNFELIYNQGFCFDIPLQGNLSDCGVVTCLVIENLCSDKAPVVVGNPNVFFCAIRVNMACRFYDCRCEDTSECGYD
ncbi:phospholipase-like protein [Tanacetum coccineum]